MFSSRIRRIEERIADLERAVADFTQRPVLVVLTAAMSPAEREQAIERARQAHPQGGVHVIRMRVKEAPALPGVPEAASAELSERAVAQRALEAKLEQGGKVL